MRKITFTLAMLLCVCMGVGAATLSSLTWANVCSGGMGASWYGSTESQGVADTVINVQKNSGGWMKNDQLHKLSSSEYSALKDKKSEHSCLDNVATTQEMRFLAKVYQGCKVERYRESFVKALNMILTAQMQVGGWGQYWPLSEAGSYQNYITFNDDLTVNALKMLRDVYNNTGDFADLVDEATREKCKKAFDRGIECIIKCQVDDNGTPAAWCAQHDTIDYLPTEGRPHELPSISGYESANLLSFLMTVENPSEELQNTITTAVEWLNNHKYIDNAKIEDYINGSGVSDRHIVSATNSAVWARFIQIGGESGTKIYNKLFTKLNNRNKKRSYKQNGTEYTYTEYEIAKNSYDASKAYQPIYSIYDDELQHLYYRFLYNYEDADSVIDWKGCLVPTSLYAQRRTSYQYLGSWCYKIINTEYPAWKQKMDLINNAGEATPYELSATTNAGNNTTAVYYFNDGFTITNNDSKAYGTGKENTVKYSNGKVYTITIPEGKAITKIAFTGYDNYAASDAYVAKVGKTEYPTTQYVFPAKVGDSYTIVTHTIDLASPASKELTFTVAGQQCCLIITAYCVDYEESDALLGDANGDGTVTMADANAVVNYFLADDKTSIENFNITNANVNGDADELGNPSITMADANAIVNIFLGNGN